MISLRSAKNRALLALSVDFWIPTFLICSRRRGNHADREIGPLHHVTASTRQPFVGCLGFTSGQFGVRWFSRKPANHRRQVDHVSGESERRAGADCSALLHTKHVRAGMVS